jgi:hypothetical protein
MTYVCYCMHCTYCSQGLCVIAQEERLFMQFVSYCMDTSIVRVVL